jgi:hypothetical protein
MFSLIICLFSVSLQQLRIHHHRPHYYYFDFLLLRPLLNIPNHPHCYFLLRIAIIILNYFLAKVLLLLPPRHYFRYQFCVKFSLFLQIFRFHISVHYIYLEILFLNQKIAIKVLRQSTIILKAITN